MTEHEEAVRAAITGGDPIKEALLDGLLAKAEAEIRARSSATVRQRRHRTDGKSVTRRDSHSDSHADVTVTGTTTSEASSSTTCYVSTGEKDCNDNSEAQSPNGSFACAKPIFGNVTEAAVGLVPPAVAARGGRGPGAEWSAIAPTKVLPGNWVIVTQAEWVQWCGEATHGQIGRLLKPVAHKYGVERLLDAIWLYAKIRRAQGRPCVLGWFASNSVEWLEHEWPSLDANGQENPTLQLLAR